MKAPRYIDRRIRPEDDAGGVDQIEVGAGEAARIDPAVDRGGGAAGHPADHVGDRAGPAEIGALALVQPENAKAVEQIAADLLAEVRGDRVARPGQRYFRPQAAVSRNVLRRSNARNQTAKQQYRESRGQMFKARRHRMQGPRSHKTVELCGRCSTLSSLPVAARSVFLAPTDFNARVR